MHFAAVTSPPNFSPPDFSRQAMAKRRVSFDSNTQNVANAATALLPPVDVNVAGEDELCTLAGVTKAKAQLIMAYRDACGGFRSPEDLLAIPRLGVSMMRKNLPRIECSPVRDGQFRGNATGGRLSPGSVGPHLGYNTGQQMSLWFKRQSRSSVPYCFLNLFYLSPIVFSLLTALSQASDGSFP